MIKISIIVNDNLYKKIVGSSLNFTSVLGATEILNNHSDIFSIVQPGIINIKINDGDKDVNLLVFEGLISFLDNSEATIITAKLFDLGCMTTVEKSELIEKLKNENISNHENIIKKIHTL
jgi:F0F1-type ATP synthase epsilon subunit